MDSILRDLRFAVRTLLKAPGFTLVAVLTLALAIGANTAVFSIVNGVLLKPLPYKDPDRLVYLRGWTVSPDNLNSWRQATDILEAVSPARSTGDLTLLSDSEMPQHVSGAHVSAEFFPMLGVQPQLGRWFLPEEDRAGAQPVAIISHRLWVRHYGSNPEVIGRLLQFDQSSFTVVGVLPDNFMWGGNQNNDVWLPMAGLKQASATAYARLRRGVTLEQAQTGLTFLAQQVEPQNDLEKYFAEREQYPRLFIGRLYENLVSRYRTQLWILFGITGFVLLIGCANVANLILTRATGRQREFAVRAALGATRNRLISQLLTETLLLFLAGGALGVLLAYGGLDFLLKLWPYNLPRQHEVGIDSAVLLTTFLITLLAGLVFGLLPGLRATRANLIQGLQGSGERTTAASGHRRLRGALVAGEIALTLILLTGAGLLLRTFLILRPVDPGFDTKNKLTFRVKLPAERYPTVVQQKEFVAQLLGKIQRLPGVESVASINHLQMGGLSTGLRVRMPDDEPAATRERRFVTSYWITPNYFELMKIPIVQGRGLTDADRPGSLPVAVINRSMAVKLWPEECPIGRKFFVTLLEGSKESEYIVVGVVGNTRFWGANLDATPELFISVHQWDFPVRYVRYVSMIVRAHSSPTSLAAGAREAVWSLDRTLPVQNVRTMEEVVFRSVATQRSRALLTGMFAGLALVLALVGIYGVLSYTVSQRIHEIGVRLALGAQRGNILRLVLRQGVVLALVGIGIGLLGSFWLTRFLKNQLYAVTPTDPLTFASVSFLLLVVSLLACYVPARRATRVDPMQALRYE